MPRLRNRRSGQALVFVALAIFVVFSFMALAVDLSLAYIIRESAQAAADVAALGGAARAFRFLKPGLDYNLCTTGGVCRTGTESCPTGRGPSSPPTSMDSACLYAAQNGFSTGGNQVVNITSGINGSLFAPGVATKYWVMAEVSDQIPQIFGGILSSQLITVRVRSVAAIVDVVGSPTTTVALVQ